MKFLKTLDGRFLAAHRIAEIHRAFMPQKDADGRPRSICPNCCYSRVPHRHVDDVDGNRHAATLREAARFINACKGAAK